MQIGKFKSRLASRRIARIWKRGGYFERARSVQTTLTRIFIDLESVSDGLSENWDEMFRKARKFKGCFRPNLGDLQKKKRSSPKFRVILRPKSEIQRFFPPKIRWSPKNKINKKKKGLRQNSEWFFGRNPKFKGFFRPNLGDLQKKKKKVFTIIETDISSNFANSDVWGGAVFEWGELFSIFYIKSASTAQKTFDFAYFTSQWGGSSPPAPPWLRYC